MVLWGYRPMGYRLGFFGLILGNLAYIVAYALPYWAVLRLHGYGLVDQTVGLWQACVYASSTCVSNVHESNPAWINAARATCSLAVFLFVLSLWCGCYRNFTKVGQERCHSPGRHVEVFSMIGCLLGTTGTIIFAFQFHAQYVQRADIGDLYWAFPLLCVSQAASAISASTMLFFNRHRFQPHPSASTLRLRGPNGLPVAVQLYAGMGDDRLHVPYFGEISRDQLVQGAVPTLPPSYELVTAGMGDYAVPPGDVADAPPLYEDIGKDCVLPSQLEAPGQDEDKVNEARDSHSGPENNRQ